MTTTPTRWASEYLPYTARDGREIPCFRIYPEDAGEADVAETNEHPEHEVQEKYAGLIARRRELDSAIATAMGEAS